MQNSGQVIKIKLDMEKVFLIFFFGLFLFLGNGFLFEHRLNHEYPYAYLASDAFQHQVRAQGIKDAGNYRNEASYIVMGIEGVVGYYPPLIYDLSVVLSHLSGLEVYDTIYFVVFMLAALSALVMYFAIRVVNKNVAIISLPISLLVFSGGIYTGFTWGHWPALASQSFLVCVLWCISRIDIEKSYVFLGIFIAATIMAHTSETIFAGIYIILFLIFSAIALRKINLNLIKTTLIGGLLALVLASYYLVIFKGVWSVRQPFEFVVSKTWDNPTMYLIDFKLLLLFMIAGMIFSIASFRKTYPIAIASFSMIVMGFGNYYGFKERAFQLRFSWPILLSFLVGFGMYRLLRLVIKNWKMAYSFIASILLIAAIVMPDVPFMPHYQIIKSGGIMDPWHWDMLKWIEQNTDKKSKVYFFYGDIFDQDALLRNAKRAHAQITPEDFVDAIEKREVRRHYESDVPGDSGGGAPYKKSFFSFGFMLDEQKPEFSFGKKDICKYDYLVFDKVSRQAVLAQYNMLIASVLAQNNAMAKVFENPVSVILKNSNPGADCIEQKNF